MRVLLVKTSSMGDIIHTLPALSDAALAIPGIKFDWVVEETFTEIPSWHFAVDQVIPIALRRWRKKTFSTKTYCEWRQLAKRLKEKEYDLILDAQGLVKSVWLNFLAQGTRAGLDWSSARESLASLAYQQKYRIDFYQHAVHRMRQLFSQALNYPLPPSPPDFSIEFLKFASASTENYCVFLHGTTWHSKQWPESYWIKLAQLLAKQGYNIKISASNEEEIARAERIAKECEAVKILPFLSIGKMARLLAGAKAAVAVDTGFGHLAAALGVRTVSLYGATDPRFTGAIGEQSRLLKANFLCSPCLKRTCMYKKLADVFPACYSTLTPELVGELLSAKANSFKY